MTDLSAEDYLHLLPARAQYRGSHLEGEIEIIEADNSEIGDDNTAIGVVYQDPYLAVVRDRVRFPSGNAGTYLRVFEQPWQAWPVGIVVLPIYEGRVLLLRIFRHATRQWEYELPRGYRDRDEDVAQAITREIAEEVGMKVIRMQTLGNIRPNTGLLASEVLAVVAEVALTTSQTGRENDEAIKEVVVRSTVDIQEMVRRGELRDSFTLAALYLAAVAGVILK